MLAHEKSVGGSYFSGEPMSDEDFSDDFHHILACIFASAEGWPYNEVGEAQDVENSGVTEITDSHIIMWAGGDWQEAMTMTLELVDGKLTVTKSEISTDDGFEDLDTRKIFGVPEFE